MRLVFMGTPDFAAAPLSELIASSHDVCAVFTQPPRPAGRGQRVTKSAVQILAEAAGIPVYTPTTLKNAADMVDLLTALKADAFVIVAYGLILPQEILDIPTWGCLNIHGSLLPRWRGAAPIHRAIEAGDTQTGVSLMKMDAGLDTGCIVLEAEVVIGAADTFTTIHDQLRDRGAALLLEGLTLIAAGKVVLQVQSEEGVTYAHKLSKAETEIHWSQTAETIARRVQGFNPWPGTWFLYGNDKVRVHAVIVLDQVHHVAPGTILDDQLTIACGEGTCLRLTQIQRPGRKPMGPQDFLNGIQKIEQMLSHSTSEHADEKC